MCLVNIENIEMRQRLTINKQILFMCIILGLCILWASYTPPVTMRTLHNQPQFNGTVVRVYDDYILVRVNEGEDVHHTNYLIYVSRNVELMISQLMSSDEVTVYFDGFIEETHPAHIYRVYAILPTFTSKKSIVSSPVRVDISRISAGISTEFSITVKHEINELTDWFANLIISRLDFDPTVMYENREHWYTYNFVLYDSNHYSWDEDDGVFIFYSDPYEYFSFSFWNYRNEWYLHFFDEWYRVENPSHPCNNSRQSQPEQQ